MFTKYRDRGLSVIPLKPGTKRPIMDEWSRYCTQLPTDRECELWDKQWTSGYKNLGLCLGPASGVCAIDIDSDKPELLAIPPLSPVRKKGNTGETRFFKWNENIRLEHKCAIDILSIGSQTVLPPSIHPDTHEQYKWLTPDTLDNFDISELPELSLDGWFAKYLSLAEILHPEKIKGGGGIGARNNWLKDVVWAKRIAEENEAEIVDSVYNLDIAKNSPRLFTDAKEGFKADNEIDAKLNAWKFVSSVTVSFAKRKAGNAPSSISSIIELNEDDNTERRKADKFTPKSFPKARGLIKDFIDYCDLKDSGDQSALGLGGALSLMAVLCSNRFNTTVRGLITTPNLYIVNLTYSSFGKNAAQNLIQDLLMETGNSNLIGSAGIRSGSALVMNLPKQQERLDIVDECSAWLKAMGGKEDYKSELVEVLSLLYSKANSKFLGFTSVSSGEHYGACWNPCVSILGSTTPAGFRSSVKREMASKGLLPRNLIFIQKELGPYKGRQNRSKLDALERSIKNSINTIVNTQRRVHPEFERSVNILAKIKDKDGNDISEGTRYNPITKLMTDKAREYWLDYDEWTHYEKAKNPEGFESAFIGRFAELTAKVALHDAVGIGADTIDIDSVEWARETIETQWHNARPLYELANAETNHESDLIRVLAIIKDHGQIKKTILSKCCSWLKMRDFEDILRQLEGQNTIEVVNVKPKSGAGRPTLYVRIPLYTPV